MATPLSSLFDDLPNVQIVDVGASWAGDNAPYHDMLLRGDATLLGFEPATDQLEILKSRGIPGTTYRSEAIGDGSIGTLHLCHSPGMTSLLEPDQRFLQHFHGFPEWARVQDTAPLKTHRLDDIPEAEGMDYLKIDIQGGELQAFQGAPRLLDEALVVQTEVQFVPFYKDQPLFAELDQTLRQHGFVFHRLVEMMSRTFAPMLINDNIFAGISQHLWADAIYVRDFTTFQDMEPTQLLKLSKVMHDVYKSIDMVGLALAKVDEKEGGNRHLQYLEWVTPQLGQ
ncbi:MAG: methyltransferase FkbM [Deltaproteobacteria bacterium]|nr:methyltransferase FkbM [Deltaproteobacteria bacterium]